MAYEPKDGDAKLFTNRDKQEGDNRPDMTGTVLLGGVTYRLSMWRKAGRNGNADWYSGRCEPQRERGASYAAPTPSREDEDIPF